MECVKGQLVTTLNCQTNWHVFPHFKQLQVKLIHARSSKIIRVSHKLFNMMTYFSVIELFQSRSRNKAWKCQRYDTKYSNIIKQLKFEKNLKQKMKTWDWEPGDTQTNSGIQIKELNLSLDKIEVELSEATLLNQNLKNVWKTIESSQDTVTNPWCSFQSSLCWQDRYTYIRLDVS